MDSDLSFEENIKFYLKQEDYTIHFIYNENQCYIID